MNLSNKLFPVLAILVLFGITVVAQEHGELLRFNDALNLDVTIRETAADKTAEFVIFQSLPSARSAAAFNRILFNGMLADQNVTLQIRFENQNGQWNEWQNTEIKIFENGRFWARFDLENSATQRIQYRFVDTGISAPARIEIYAIEGLDVKHEHQSSAESEPAAPNRTTFAKMDTVPQPAIISRSQWGANPPNGTYVPHSPFRFAQHHTAGRRVSTQADGIAEMQFIQDFHQNGRGWQDIGYHFCIDDAGRIYEGVPPDFRGTHAGGNNTGNIGISYMGNFHVSGEFPTQAALDLSLIHI